MFSNRKNKRSSNTFGRMETLETRKLMYGADCLAADPVATETVEIAIVAPAPDSEAAEPVKKRDKDYWAEVVAKVDKDLEDLTEWTIETSSGSGS